MAARNPAQPGVAEPTRVEESAVDDRPTCLQRALIGLCKGSAGQENGGEPELLRLERAQVVGKNPDFFQFGGCGGDLFADLGKGAELRIDRLVRRRFLVRWNIDGSKGAEHQFQMC